MNWLRKGWGLLSWEIQEWLVGLNEEGLGYLLLAIFCGKISGTCWGVLCWCWHQGLPSLSGASHWSWLLGEARSRKWSDCQMYTWSIGTPVMDSYGSPGCLYVMVLCLSWYCPDNFKRVWISCCIYHCCDSGSCMSCCGKDCGMGSCCASRCSIYGSGQTFAICQCCILIGVMALYLWETWLCFLGMITGVFFSTGLWSGSDRHTCSTP